MAINVYNTLQRKKVPLETREPGVVNIYSCGITPYASTHLGHARQYVLWDVFRRYLTWKGYQVKYIQNFTDIDDNIIRKANAENLPTSEIAGRYINEYFEVMDSLGVSRADLYPMVTEHIDDVIKLVQKLVEKGLAYEVDGDVFFDVSEYQPYGKLSGRSIEEMEAGARVEVNERKSDPMDFAVWKAAKPGEPAWDSPWGKGRPGWHIECSAMALKYLGAGFELHGGGMDLVFPHHENEIAQAEGGTDQTFARYWMHHGFINVNAEKMSKSLGNFKSVKDVLKLYDPITVRLFLLSTHYRSPIYYSEDELVMSRKGKDRLANGLKKLQELASRRSDDTNSVESGASDNLMAAAQNAQSKFTAAMDDDFNTALAIAALYDIVREINKTAANPGIKAGGYLPSADAALKIVSELYGILGFGAITEQENDESDQISINGDSDGLANGLMELLLDIRKEARAAKNWALSDKIRDGFKSLGITVEDTAEGTRWRKADGQWK